MKPNLYQYSLYICPACQYPFSSNCALSLHQTKSIYCNDYILSSQHPQSDLPHKHENLEGELNYSTNNNNNQLNNNNLNCTDQLSDEQPLDDIDDTCSVDSGKSISSNLFHYTNEINHEIKLLKIITDIGAPLYSYELLMQWAHEAHMSSFKFDTKHKTYQQTIKYL